jgi:hypothetical protein
MIIALVVGISVALVLAFAFWFFNRGEIPEK